MPWFCTIFLLSILGCCPSKALVSQRVVQLNFELGKRCTYSYQVAVHTARGSHSTESQGHEIHALVDVTPVAQETNQNALHTLRLHVYQPRMRRVRGDRVLVNHPVNEELERQLSKPFYFRQYGHGSVLDAFFPKYDDPKVIALKKGIAGAFQVQLKSLEEKRRRQFQEHDDSGVYFSKYTTLHSNDTHATIQREWTNKDYLLLPDGTPVKGEHKVQSQHIGTVHIGHGQIFKVHREHNGIFENPKGNPRAENSPKFQESEQDIQVLTSGYSKLNLIGCEDYPNSHHHRSRRETVMGDVHEQEIQGLFRDNLVFKDAHRIDWKNVGGEKMTFKPFYNLMRCFTDPTVKERQIGDCVMEIHKLAKYDSSVFKHICHLVLGRTHQNVTSWSVLVSVLAGHGSQHSQDVLARALMSEYPRKLTLDEYEALLEGIFYIPKGPLHRKLFDALLQHAERDRNHGHQSPMAMLVLSGLVKRAETAGYNNSLSDIVIQVIHSSYNNKSNLYHPESEEHETFLRNHLWAFGNLGHLSGLSTMLQHANHDSSGIRSAVVSGMRKLPEEHVDKFLLNTLLKDERNDVKAAVMEVYIERHQDLSNEIVEALEHAFWHAEDNDVLDETVQTFLENHHKHPKVKHIRKRRHILRRQKRALIQDLKPREIELGPNRRWLKAFGGKYLGAECALQFRNQVKLRVGIFGGKFEVDLSNYAKIDAYILKYGFDIVKGKAAFKASASFKNDIPKDLIHTVADAGDFVFSKVDGITNIILEHIEKFKEKLKTLIPLNVQRLIDFVKKITRFVENLFKPLKPINVMKKILSLAKKVSERLKNWEWFVKNVRGIQITLNKQTVVDNVFKNVMGALNKTMSIINSIKLRLPHSLLPNFKIEDLLKWLKSVSIDLHDIKIKEFFKSLGLNFVPKGFNLQMPFRFSMHFSFSMDKFIDMCMKIIEFAKKFLNLSSLLDALENIRLPRLNLPRLEAKFPLQPVKWFNFGLSFDWKINLKFDLDLKNPKFLKFVNFLGNLSNFFKRFKLSSFDLEQFFLADIMSSNTSDLSKLFPELFGKNGNLTTVGRSPADVLQDFFDKVLKLIDSGMPNITAISDVTDFFKELGPEMKGFVKKNAEKICSVYKIASNSSRDFKTFSENIQKEGIAILKTVDNTTKSALNELVQYTKMVDRLIDNIEKNFTLATRGFVSKSLKELSKSLQEIKSFADKVIQFANGTSAKFNGVCNKAEVFSAKIIDDVQIVSRQALSELTSFIGPVSQKIKGIGRDLKLAVNNIEAWYKENMEVRAGKISKIARFVADFMSILNTNKGFLWKVHEISVKVNNILTLMKNIPAYAQKASESTDDIIKFSGSAQKFKDDIEKLDIKKEFRVSYDQKVHEYCVKVKKMADEALNKIGGHDIAHEVNEFFTEEAEKLITTAGSKLRRIKQPIEEIRTDLKEISVMVNNVIDVMINLKPFSNNFSPILATIHKLPDCQQAVQILIESTKPCVQKAMVVGKNTIDKYKDMRKEVKILHDMIPETWKSLKIQKCIKGSACIPRTFIDQAKVIQEKVEKVTKSYEEAEGYTDMLGTCRSGLDNITEVISTVKLLIQQTTDFNFKSNSENIKYMLMNITGQTFAQPSGDPHVRSKISIKDENVKITLVMDYVQKAEVTRQKLEETLKNTFKSMKSLYDNPILDHIKKIEDLSKKVNTSYELWTKTKNANAILQGLGNLFKESSDYATKMTAITNGFSSPVLKLLIDTGELRDFIKPYMSKYIGEVKKATDKINGLFNKVTEFQNKIQLRQRGLDLSQYKEWSEYPYCSADVCLRPIRRSSSLYYKTIFTWKFPHLDDLSSMKDSGRWLAPGLFDDYKVEGITQLSNSEILLGLHGVSSSKGKASLLVVTDLGRNSVKKIIQLGSPQSPFTVAIGGITIAKDSIWISDGESNKVHRISKESVTGKMGSAAPSWIPIAKSYSVEGIGTSVSFDEQTKMLWITDGNAGKGYGYHLTALGNLLSAGLAPDKVLVIGKDAQGMAIVRQFSTEYAVVSRCVARAGYQCKLEFHDLTDGHELSENSLSRVVRTPFGLESVDKVSNDRLVIAFSSGTYSEKDKIESIGGDFEDRYFRMKLPILKMTLDITENCVMLKVMGEWIISPRRLFPIGDLRCGALRKRSIQNELLESDVYSQELEEVHRRTKRNSGEVSSCMAPFRKNLIKRHQKFMPDFEQFLPVFGIPIKLHAGAGGHWVLDYHGTVCVKDKKFKMGIIPGAWIRVNFGVSISLLIVEAGVTFEAILLETYFIPELTVKIDKWPLKACIELKMQMTPLKIRVYLWYRLRLSITLRTGIIWVLPIIKWCSKNTFAEWSWSARTIERQLFKTCKKDFDRTPPVAGTCSARQVGDKAYFVQWHGFKEDTHINHYWVKIGSILGSGDDYGANVGIVLSVVVRDLPIMDGRDVFASVRATNDEGLDSSLSLCPVFRAKRIGPQILFLYDGSQIGVDKDFQSDDYVIGLNFEWNNAEEQWNKKKIVDVKWGISSSSKCTFNEKELDIYGLAPVGETKSIQTSGLKLNHGFKYYTRIIATNSAGLRTIVCSDGVTIDKTPPIAGRFYDGAGETDVDFMPSTKRVRATFESFTDGESPLVKYEWKIVKYISVKSIDLTPFVNILLSQRTPLMENLDLQLGQKYNLVLRGTNSAGLQTTKESNGFFADITSPTCKSVLDVVSINDSLDVDFVRQLKSIQAKWSCMDQESGITKQFIAVGTYPGGDDVKLFENMQNTSIVQLGHASFAKVVNLEVKPKIRYHVTIKAYNGVGLRRTVTSDGILIDTTPPSVALQYIKDGFQGKDVNHTKERFSFSAHWEQAFVDAESDMTEFLIGLGSAPGATDVKALTKIGKATKATLRGLILDAGRKYYVTVVGCNGVQMCINGSSNGAVVDFVPPHTGLVITGYTGPPVVFQWITKSVWARWNWCSEDKNRSTEIIDRSKCAKNTFYDVHSGITSFGLSVGTFSSEEFLYAFTEVGKVQMSGRSIDLEDGVYTVAVRAKDKAGMAADGLSNTFIVDSSPVKIINLQHGHQGTTIKYTKDHEYRFQAYFELEDDLSRVFGFQVYVGSYPGADDVSASKDIKVLRPPYNLAMNWTAERFTKLENNRKYFITVLASNGAGLVGSGSSQALFSDTEPPKHAIVLDGWGMEDVKYQSYSSIYRAHWYGMSDFSGIHSVYLGLKSTLGKHDCDVRVYEIVPNDVNNHVLFGLNLKSGSKYFACLKVVDNAQNVAYFSSNGVIIDTSPPVPGKVIDGIEADIDVQTDSSILWATWRNFKEVETEIVRYMLAFGTSPGNDDIQEFTNVGLVQNAASTRLRVSKLTSGERYYATVIALNSVGIKSTPVSSNGVKVDATPPVFVIRVTHGSGKGKVDKFTGLQSLDIYWKCVDNETGLNSVDIAFGLQPGSHDVMNLTNVPAHQTKYTLHSNLQLGLRYFATVICKNKAGLKSISSSVGVVYDNTPPQGLNVFDGDYQNCTSEMTVQWKFIDIESGISNYQIFVVNSDQSFQQGPYEFTGNVKSASISFKLPLEFGKRYYTNVTAYNVVWMKSSLLSDGFIIDNTAPTCKNVWHGNKEIQRFIGITSTLLISWECAENESVITQVRFAVQDMSNQHFVLPFHSKKEKLNATGTTLVTGNGKWLPKYEEGKKYRVGIELTNKVDLKSTFWTNGVLVDSTPPVANNLKLKFNPISNTIDASWKLKDEQSGIASLTWGLGTRSGDPNIVNQQKIDKATSALRLGQSQVQVQQGKSYFFFLFPTNNAGLSSKAVSNGIVIDRSPPKAGIVIAQYALPLNYDRNKDKVPGSSLSVSWTGFLDEESGIAEYGWAVGSVLETVQNLDDSYFTDIPVNQSIGGVQIYNFTLVGNTTYFVCIRATNGAGLQRTNCSNAMKVVLGKFSAGIVNDGPMNFKKDLDFQLDDRAIWAHWDGFEDPVFGVSDYEWCIDDHQPVPSSNFLCKWSFMKVNHLRKYAHRFYNITLSHGRTYYATVRAFNSRGESVYSTSDGVLVDRSIPYGNVIQVSPTTGKDTLFISSLSPPTITWEMDDQESGISFFTVGVGTYPNHDDLLQFTRLNSLQRSVDLDDLNFTMSHGLSFVVTVTGYNMLGLRSTLSSQQVVVDLTPPESGVVYDGNSTYQIDGLRLDSDYQTSSQALSAHWFGFEDQESRIVEHRWCIGSRQGSCDIIAMTSTGLETSATAHLNLQQGTRYFTTVEAENSAGLKVLTSSDGVTMDSSPPIIGIISFVQPSEDTTLKMVNGVFFQSNGKQFKLEWGQVSDDESGIASLLYCVGKNRSVCDVKEWTVLEPEASSLLGNFENPLSSGTTIYVSLKAENGAGLRTIKESDGLLLDWSPPTVQAVTVGNVAGTKYLQEDEGFEANWSDFNDPESGLDHYEWAVCQAVNLEECLTPFIDTGLSTKIKNDNLDLKPGISYALRVKAYNKIGLHSSAISNIFVTDNSLPTPGDVFDGNDPSSDQSVQSSSKTISANWDPFKATNSRIIKYEMCIGSRQSFCDVHPFQSIGDTFVGEVTGLSLAHKQTYYTTIRSTNDAGYQASASSNGVKIDKTLPVGGSVRDGSDSEDIDFQASGTFISANWDQFTDEETGISKYVWCVGTIPGSCDVVQEREITDGRTKVQIQINPSVVSGVSVFVKVTAVNGAGGMNTLYSDGVKIDNSPPEVKKVNDLETNGSLADIDFLTSKTKFCASWDAADQESGILKSEISVCTENNRKNCLASSVDVGNCSLICMSNLDFIPGVKYITTISVTNAVGLSTSADSDGFTLDFTPPVGGQVKVGNTSSDVESTTDNFASSAISASWNGFWDKETAIVKYHVCLGNHSGSCEVEGWKDVGLSTEYTFDGTDLTSESIYYVSVVAENDAGLKSIVEFSQGIIIDKTVPISGGDVVYDGIEEGSDIEFQLIDYEISANWKPFEDPESGILKLTYCVGTTPGNCDILSRQNLSPWLHKIRKILTQPQKNGHRLYVTVQATNGAGIKKTLSSDGVTIDNTPPIPGQVNDGNSSNDIDYLFGEDDVYVTWSNFRDDQSGIKNYEVAICEAINIKECPQNYTNVNNVTSVKITGLDLHSGRLYLAKVKATNQAGLKIEVSSNGFAVDFTPPVAKVAWIGPSVVRKAQYEAHDKKLHVRWFPFIDDESGVMQYELCVQSSTSSAECTPYQSVGEVTDYELTGLNLQHGQSYFVNIRATNGVGMTVSTRTKDILIDTTPPKLVDQSPGSHVHFFCTEELVSVNWDEFEDSESYVDRYEWCVGTAPGKCDVTDRKSVGLKLIGREIVKRLPSGSHLYATVHVFNKAGIKSVVMSKQCIVITVAPMVNMVSDLEYNSSSDVDIDWTSNIKTLSFQWSTIGKFLDDISRLEVAVTRRSKHTTLPRLEPEKSWKGEPIAQPFMALHPGQQNVTIETIPIAPWEEYHVVIRLFNGGDIYTDKSSDGLRIEASPPLTRNVDLLNSAEEDERKRWLPDMHLPLFNLTELDPDVNYVSSPDDISIVVIDKPNGTDASLANLNRVLDSEFSPTEIFKLVVNRVTSNSNVTNTTEQSLETKKLPGFAIPSGPCCTNQNPHWLVIESDFHYKPTSSRKMFGSCVLQLPYELVAVSSSHALFIFSKKNRLHKTKVFSVGDQRTISSLSYSENHLAVASNSHISILRLRFNGNGEANLDLEASLSASRWPGITAEAVAIKNTTLVTSGKSASLNTAVVLIFKGKNGIWKLLKVLRRSERDLVFGNSLALNGEILAVSAGNDNVIIYSAYDYSIIRKIDLKNFYVVKPSLRLTKGNALVAVSKKPNGKVVVIQINTSLNTTKTVCSYDVPADVRLSGKFDLMARDGGTVVALGMQTMKGRDGVILTGFDGSYAYHPFHEKGKCIGLGRIIAYEDVPRVDDGTPRASVSAEGSTILFGAPGMMTWSGGSEEDGTGRLYSMVHCPRNYKRIRNSNIKVQDTFQCAPCEPGRKSHGAITSICEICAGRKCALALDDDPIHFVTKICNTSQCPLVKKFDNETNAMKVQQAEHTFFEEGAFNEYTVHVIEITRAKMSTTSKSKPFIIDTTSPTVGTVYDGLGSDSKTNCSKNETFGEDSQCSTRKFQDTDIDYTNITSEVHARWVDFADNESDIAEYFFCVGSKPMKDDIRRCESNGLRQNASKFDFDFKQGDTYYVTVVACNGARRCSAGYSNGVTIDTTPPKMLYVRDGVLGPDIDYQVFVDIIFAYFKASDPDSGVASYEVAWGTSPGMIDTKEFEEIGNTTIWFAQFEDNSLKKNTKYYATARATNKAGLMSEDLSSNGVLVGKSEYVFDQNASASFFFDSVNMNPNGTRKDGGVGQTYGTLDVPQGAVEDKAKLTCYSLDEMTLKSNNSDDGPVANPETTKPKQFMLGNYSFQIKAHDPQNNTLMEGYKFSKPIKVTMFYDVDNLINANRRIVNNDLNKEDVDPVLYLWDIKNQTWINAALSCEEPWSHVNRSIKMLTVQICHLTQFSFFWTFKAQRGLMMFDKNSSVYDSNGNIYIDRQSSAQEIELPVKRSKGSSGSIEVYWSLHSNHSDLHKIMWPESGKVQFQEGQWDASISVVVTSDKEKTDERTIFVRLTNATGGAILASNESTSTKFAISSNLVAVPKTSATKSVIIGVSSAIAVSLLIILNGVRRQP